MFFYKIFLIFIFVSCNKCGPYPGFENKKPVRRFLPLTTCDYLFVPLLPLLPSHLLVTKGQPVLPSQLLPLLPVRFCILSWIRTTAIVRVMIKSKARFCASGFYFYFTCFTCFTCFWPLACELLPGPCCLGFARLRCCCNLAQARVGLGQLTSDLCFWLSFLFLLPSLLSFTLATGLWPVGFLFLFDCEHLLPPLPPLPSLPLLPVRFCILI